MIGELITRCFHARTNAHELHLTSPTYAKHVALQEFYDGLLPLIDSVAEMVQDDEDITFAPLAYKRKDDPAALLRELRDWLRDNRYDAVPAEDTEVQNVLDEIVGLCRTTLYKLRKLK